MTTPWELEQDVVWKAFIDVIRSHSSGAERGKISHQDSVAGTLLDSRLFCIENILIYLNTFYGLILSISLNYREHCDLQTLILQQ